MIGPLVLAVVGGVVGALAGGWAGLVGGLLIAFSVVAAVAAGASVWAQQIGAAMDPQEARAAAPCPPGFSTICARVYRRLGREIDGDP